MKKTLTQTLIEGLISKSHLVNEIKKQVDSSNEDINYLVDVVQNMMTTVDRLNNIVGQQDQIIRDLIGSFGDSSGLDMTFSEIEIDKTKLN